MKLIELLKKNNLPSYFIIIIFIIFQSCSSKPVDAKPNDIQYSKNSIELLRTDYKLKKISNDEYYLYLTYAIFSPESLPFNYQGTVGPKDGTPVIIEVQRAFHTINPENQRIIRKWIRPLPKKPNKRQP
tara:strand:- start:1708 stop:2094 length:387 start_codon:yes stop_codon:yes gene_type:complete